MSPAVDGVWPPAGIETFDPWHLPLINTLILLCSGCAATWAHHALVHENNRKDMATGLILAVSLGLIFTVFQAYEYSHAAFGFLRQYLRRQLLHGDRLPRRPRDHRHDLPVRLLSCGCGPGISPRRAISASRPRPGTGTSSTWSGCSCSSPSISGAGEPGEISCLRRAYLIQQEARGRGIGLRPAASLPEGSRAVKRYIAPSADRPCRCRGNPDRARGLAGAAPGLEGGDPRRRDRGSASPRRAGPGSSTCRSRARPIPAGARHPGAHRACGSCMFWSRPGSWGRGSASSPALTTDDGRRLLLDRGFVRQRVQE